MKADLHCHTTFSDGKFTVQEVLTYASQRGLDYLSITDHDTFAGSRVACAIPTRLKIIIGIELSTYLNDESVHILGFFNNWKQVESLQPFLDKQIQKREDRAYRMIENLKVMHGLHLNPAFLKKLNSITRGSIAREMINQQLAGDHKEVFTKYLGDDCPAYIPSTKVSTQKGIDLIHQCGGLAVLAHPMNLKKNDPVTIIKLGVDGLEAIYPRSQDQEGLYRQMAKDHGIFITAGNDFHALNDTKHGAIGDLVLSGRDLDIFLGALYES
ncbi:MAG: PHP domain-containing protein [Bacilli bacterium]